MTSLTFPRITTGVASLGVAALTATAVGVLPVVAQDSSLTLSTPVSLTAGDTWLAGNPFADFFESIGVGDFVRFIDSPDFSLFPLVAGVEGLFEVGVIMPLAYLVGTPLVLLTEGPAGLLTLLEPLGSLPGAIGSALDNIGAMLGLGGSDLGGLFDFSWLTDMFGGTGDLSSIFDGSWLTDLFGGTGGLDSILDGSWLTDLFGGTGGLDSILDGSWLTDLFGGTGGLGGLDGLLDGSWMNDLFGGTGGLDSIFDGSWMNDLFGGTSDMGGLFDFSWLTDMFGG